MSREMLEKLNTHARRAHRPRAAVAAKLLKIALSDSATDAPRWKLATDYIAEPEDARELTAEMESAQLEV